MKTSLTSGSHLISIIALALFLLSSQVVLAATSYVTFNDGRLIVFPDSCLQNQSADGGFLSFTDLDGTVYSYPLEDISSVSDQLQKELPEMTAYMFSKEHNYQVFSNATGVIDGDEIKVQVAGIGKWLTATFTLSDEAARAYVDEAEQVSGRSRMRFYPARVYTVGYPGDLILSPHPYGGYALLPYGRQYTVRVDYLVDHSTSVPRIDINTVGGVNITSRIDYVDAEIIIDGAGVFPSMTDSVKIRGRGNSSWSSNPNAKNPYRLKFAHKVKPLGLTKGKNWVLLANKIRGSMLTNAIGMKSASLIGTVAANHIVPVDLYINGIYKGSYNFTEKVGFSNNSVDIEDERVAALLELDIYHDEDAGQRFRSTPFNLPVNIKEPEFSEMTSFLSLKDIRTRFNAFARAVDNNDKVNQHADLDQLARYLLFNELICNLELYHPKSTFCYYENVLDEDSKLIFGPAWDLDWAFGFDGGQAHSYFSNQVDCNYFDRLTPASFFSRLGNNFQVASRMFLLMRDFIDEGLDELCDYCREYYQYAKPSLSKNSTVTNDATDYSAQANKAVNWLRQRAGYVYEDLKLKYELPGDVNDDREVNIGDVNALFDIILGGYADAETRVRADINHDGEITIGDINRLINLILGAF